MIFAPFMLITLLGCPKPVVPLGQTVVEDIRFEGNGWGPFARDGDGLLADTIETHASKRFFDVPVRADWGPYLGDIGTMDEELLAGDGDRIVTWYAHHGWFDAKFLGWTTLPRKLTGPGGAPAVDLVATVEPGERSRLDTDPELLGTTTLQKPLRKALEKLIGPRAGDPFSLAAYTDTLTTLQAQLQERSYAYSKVSGHVTVRPDLHQVHITYTIEPGRPCVFGDITVAGEKGALAERIRRELDFETGDGFRASKLLAARQRLYGLGVYSLVEILPDLRTPDERGVPVTVRLQRRPSRQVAVGPSAAVETNTQKLSVNASFQDDDAFKLLWRWKADAEAGVATAVDVTQDSTIDQQVTDTFTPIGSLSQMLTIPHVGSEKLTATGATSVSLDREPSYRELEAQMAPALSYAPSQKLTLSVGYRLKYHQYFDFADLNLVEKTKLSATVREKSLLSLMEQSFIWDTRDDKLAPTRNYYASLKLGEAGGPLGGDMGFFRSEGEVRGYRSMHVGRTDFGTVFAARLGGGVIVQYDPNVGVDVDERLTLGGGSSVRGWAEDRLGPHVCYVSETQGLSLDAAGNVDCAPVDADGQPVDIVIEPVGGNLKAFGNLEVRQTLPYRLGVVLFVDAGRVWDRVENAAFDELQWSVGAGLRYTSPIGPIRADFAWVPEPDPYFAAEPAWAFHLGIGEAF
ncbi:hypothetical protein LBMAG42_34110 [Deltaproteobacteria bacterium]|nr:hypothetical protein LBMAG42_34110 [Deltaproteobacteria bacterium]